MTVHGRNVNWCVGISVSYVHVGTSLDEKLHNLEGTFLASQSKCRITMLANVSFDNNSYQIFGVEVVTAYLKHFLKYLMLTEF